MKRLLVAFCCLWAACGSSQPEASAPEQGPAPTVARKFIHPEGSAAGPYTPGVMAGRTLYLAGQVDRNPATGEYPEGIEAQTSQAMENVGAILTAAGLTYSNLVSCHVQLVDMDDYQAMNGVYGSFFEEGRYPARTTLQMPGLVGEASIEVSCIAYADMASIEIVRPDPEKIPAAMGPYSPAVLAGDTLYLSGQGGRNPQTGEMPTDVVAEAEQTLENIGHMLEAAQLDFSDAVFVNVYHIGPETRAQVDEAYATRFQAGAAPSRGIFQLARLPGDINDEITFIASRAEPIDRLFMPGVEPTATTTPATLAGDTLYLSGYAAPEAGDFAAQFKAVMEQQKARLELAGMGFQNVVNANVYLTNTSDFAGMNELFVGYFPENPPARTTVAVRQEAERAGTLVEVSLIAVK